MKKFELKLAKGGSELITKSGKPVEILKYDRNNNVFPIVAIIDNREVICCTIEGKYFKDKDSEKDLMIK